MGFTTLVETGPDDHQSGVGMAGRKGFPGLQQHVVSLDPAAAVHTAFRRVDVGDHDDDEGVRADAHVSPGPGPLVGVGRHEVAGVNAVRDGRRTLRTQAQRPVGVGGEGAAAHGDVVQPGQRALAQPDDLRLQVEGAGHHVHASDPHAHRGQTSGQGRGVQVVVDDVRAQRADLSAQAPQPVGGTQVRSEPELERGVQHRHAALGEGVAQPSAGREHGNHMVTPSQQFLDVGHRPQATFGGLEHEHDPQPSWTHRAGTPFTTVAAGTSRTTHAQAPTVASRPTRNPCRTAEFVPTRTPSSR